MSQGCATLMPSAQHATAAKGTAFVGLCRVELLLVPPGHRGLSGAQKAGSAFFFSSGATCTNVSTVTRESGVDMEIWRGGFLFI